MRYLLGEPGVGVITQTVRRERGDICRRRKQLLVLKTAVSILITLVRSAMLSVGVNARFAWPPWDQDDPPCLCCWDGARSQFPSWWAGACGVWRAVFFFWEKGGGVHAVGHVCCSIVCAFPPPTFWVQARCANGVFWPQCVWTSWYVQSQEMLHTPRFFSPRLCLTAQRRLEIFLGGRPVLLMLC